MSDAAPPDAGPDPVGYAEAMAELEAILAEIEDEAVDVDVLARKVARAAHLVRWCRGRIDGARVDVERIIADLDPDARSEPDPT
ncbi:MAG TPA: exodeoxyribonuclease VII small subunit [Iamia sp.]|nr:exodeoxyribonuclease VII small subunit [Iamia sp.]